MLISRSQKLLPLKANHKRFRVKLTTAKLIYSKIKPNLMKQSPNKNYLVNKLNY